MTDVDVDRLREPEFYDEVKTWLHEQAEDTTIPMFAHALAVINDLQSENQVLCEVMPCTWCNDIGVVPEEAFGRDEDGAPMVDGVQPCPEGCALPGWLIAERNDARDDAAELDRLRGLLAEHKRTQATGGPAPAETREWGNERHVPPTESAARTDMAPPARYQASNAERSKQ